MDYANDAVGNITQLAQTVNGATRTKAIVYDNLNRLKEVREASALIEGYSYDATGNRLSRQPGTQASQAYTYGAASHRLGSVAGTARAYDAAGNTGSIASTPAIEMIHDQRNRLTEYRSGGSTLASYQYSGRGERVAKTQGAATQRFVYDEAGRLIYETGSGSPRTYLRSDDAPIAVIDGTALTGYIVPDNLGTPRAITNSAGTAIWRWDQVTGSTTTGGSAVFGQGAANTDPDGNGTHLTFNPRFPGQYFDAESGLHYNYFRHYEPLTGRYVQSDPIGLDIDISTYSYARTKTLNTVDPFGLYGDVDRALLQCYTSGGCDSFDISRSCNDYLRDPLISTWRTRAKTTARAKVRQRIPIVGPFSFSKKGGAENYVTTIYSMASGYDNWELSCTGASDGCCASADCTFRLWRIDRFEDVYDLGQNTGTDPSGFLANFGGEGTPFTFYINCRDTFSVKECKE